MRPVKRSPPIRKKKTESDLNALNTSNVHPHLFFVFISTSVANMHQTLSLLEAEIRQKARDACKLMPTSFEKD